MRYYLVKDADRWAAQDLGEPNGAELQLHLTADEDPTQVHLLSMDIRALEALCAEVTRKQAVTLVSLNDTGLTLTASADASAPVLMLPIANTPGWRCTVDGEETAIQPAVGTLIGIPLSPGTHSVELVFRTKGLTAGLVLTGLGVLLAAVIAWAERRGRMLLADSPRLINGITLGLLIAAWGGAIAVLYVYLILHAFWLDILFQMPV